MTFRNFGDATWERMKDRWPQLGDFDRTYDQSHLHHTLIIGGPIALLGVLAAVITGLPLAYGHGAGVIAGLAAYLYRERWPLLWLGARYAAPTMQVPWDRSRRWDGTMDVLVPAAILLPLALVELGAIAIPVAWLLQQSLGAGVAWGYSFGRPRGLLLYGEEAQ